MSSEPTWCGPGGCNMGMLTNWLEWIAPIPVGSSCASTGKASSPGYIGCHRIPYAAAGIPKCSRLPGGGALFGGAFTSDPTGTLCPGPRCATGLLGQVIPGTGGQREKCICANNGTWDAASSTCLPPCPTPITTTPVTGDANCANTMFAVQGYNVKCDYSCNSPLPPTCSFTQTSIGNACSTPSGMFGFGGCPGCVATSCQLVPNGASPLPFVLPSYCASPSPSPSSSPTSTPPPFDPLAHRCGTEGLATSMPSPRPSGMPSDFNKLMNPMAACCWNGWAQPGNLPSTKMDCIERVVAPNEDFLRFYYEGGPRATPPLSTTADPVTLAGVNYPNQLFMLNAAGTAPINGFYNAKGERCSYSTGPKTADQQMDLFDAALDAGAPPADVLPTCCNLVLLALERKCPDRDPTSTGQHWRASPPESVVTRCTAASEMKVHFALYDLCNPSSKKRARFHGATSIGGLANTDHFPVVPLELDTLIKKSFPASIPAPAPCPSGFSKNAAGKCEIL